MRLAYNLIRAGYEVVGIDSSIHAVERARDIGVEANVADALKGEGLDRMLKGVKLVATALPGDIGLSVVAKLARMGYNVVDVSFFKDNVEWLSAEATRNGVYVVVDAGVAPGLSNMLVAMGVRRVSGRRARILVGGITERPEPPLGIAATWSVSDLIEEYVRPARMIKGGRLVEVDPLESGVEIVDVEGVGVLECFPTDGLRSLLRSFSWLEELYECTLRWPGHVEFMRGLKKLGFLGREVLRVGGCPLSPRELLEKIIVRKHSGLRDIVVLRVEVTGPRELLRYTTVVRHDGKWSAMSIATAAFQAAVVMLALERGGAWRGVIYPEEFGMRSDYSEFILDYLRSQGISIRETVLSLT